MAIWSLGITYLLIRLVQREYALKRSLQEAQAVDNSGNLRPVFVEIRRLMGIENLPCIMLWRDGKIRITPLTAGIFRPVVILSKSLLENLDHGELCDVLVHEFAHVLRHDQLIGLLQRIVEIMFWPYPLVWLMNRNLARAREEVCDNYVLKHTDGPRYAQTLFDLSLRILPLSPSLAQVGLFQHYWSLEQRIAGLLDTRRTIMTKINRLTAAALVTVFLAITLTVAGAKILQAETQPENAAGAAMAGEKADLDGEAKVKPPQSSQRVLKFPNDRVLGRILVQDEQNEKTNNTSSHIDKMSNWVVLGQARGAVTVPAGKCVKLQLYPDKLQRNNSTVPDLSPLSSLDPDDLDELKLADFSINDQAMLHVGHLTGLKALELAGSTISDAALPTSRALNRWSI